MAKATDVTLEELVAAKMLSASMASLLSAAVAARVGIVVAGEPAEGRTILLRALCGGIDPLEVVGTFEAEPDPRLHELLAARHAIVQAWSGAAPEDQILDAFRFRLDRAILVDVEGPELRLLTRLQHVAAGWLVSVRDESARQAVVQLGPAAAAEPVLAVQLAPNGQPDPEEVGSRCVVTEVVAARGESEAPSVVLGSRAGGCAAVGMLPDRLMERLVAHGLDVVAFQAGAEANGKPPRGL